MAPPRHLVERLLAFGALALSLAAADMATKEYVPTPDVGLHPRSFAWALGSIVLIAAAIPLLRLPSWCVAVAAGVMAGGTLGNLVSALVYGGNVPNPILIGDYDDRGIAFNLADVFTFFGILALTVSLVVVSIRHRDRLLPPRAWERRIWDKLGPLAAPANLQVLRERQRAGHRDDHLHGLAAAQLRLAARARRHVHRHLLEAQAGVDDADERLDLGRLARELLRQERERLRVHGVEAAGRVAERAL